MGTDKRERKKANRQARLEAQQAEEARRRRIRFIRNALILTAAIIVTGLLLSLAACGSDDGGDDDAAPSRGDSQEQGTDEGAGAASAGECPPEEGVDTPVLQFESAPEGCIDPAGSYTATVETSLGTVVVELDTERTPATAGNFVALARYGYYDGTELFRTEAATGIIQGGSPHTQDAADPGPGYTIDDEALPFTSEDYAPGTLAMARTAAPDSASAQFFFLASEGGRYLGDPAAVGQGAGSYVVFGRTVEGLDVLERIAALDDGSGAPSEPVRIESVEITES